MSNIKKHTINKTANVKQALEKINEFDCNNPMVLFVTDENTRIIGSVTDGDIRRGLLKGCDLNNCVTDVMHKDFNYIKNLDNYKKIKKMKDLDLKIIPHITEEKKLIDFIDLTRIRAMLPIDAVIMAGGKGVRLKPYTNDIPKPMLDLNGKPIIAHNIDRLISYGVKNFYIALNHLKDQIVSYINKNYPEVSITYLEEDLPLGTMGAVSLAEKFINEDILVINADVLTNIDFEDFYVNFKNFKDDMSVATFNVRINIPYAVLETEDKKIKSFVEKPSYIYYSNAGIYLLRKEFVKTVPKNKKYDSTDLIEDLIKKGKKVSHFPIRGYWLDIGTAQNYAKAQDDIKYIRF